MNCANHQQTPAAAYCRTCGKPLCAACTRPVMGVIYCETCLAERMGGVAPSQTPYQPAAAYPVRPQPPGPGQVMEERQQRDRIRAARHRHEQMLTWNKQLLLTHRPNKLGQQCRSCCGPGRMRKKWWGGWGNPLSLATRVLRWSSLEARSWDPPGHIGSHRTCLIRRASPRRTELFSSLLDGDLMIIVSRGYGY